MVRIVLLLTLLTTLTACYSREEWGAAMIGAADRLQNSRTVYCTTNRYGSTYRTSCY